MFTAKKAKEYAKKSGADIVGIASIDRFEGAPKEMDPRYIFPEAKALIALTYRIPEPAVESDRLHQNPAFPAGKPRQKPLHVPES